MRAEITYPPKRKQRVQRRDLIRWARWPFLLAALVPAAVNLCVGGKAWSVVVLWSVWIVWTLVVSTDLVEYNRISQSVKLILRTSVLLILIDVFLAPGWAIEVVPLVCCAGLVVGGTLLFTDLDRQKKNISPVLFLIGVSAVGSVTALLIWRQESRWALIVMGLSALALLAACAAVLGRDFLREVKKYFHTR